MYYVWFKPIRGFHSLGMAFWVKLSLLPLLHVPQWHATFLFTSSCFGPLRDCHLIIQTNNESYFETLFLWPLGLLEFDQTHSRSSIETHVPFQTCQWEIVSHKHMLKFRPKTPYYLGECWTWKKGVGFPYPSTIHSSKGQKPWGTFIEGEATHIWKHWFWKRSLASQRSKNFGLDMRLTSRSKVSRLVPLLLGRILYFQLRSKTMILSVLKPSFSIRVENGQI